MFIIFRNNSYEYINSNNFPRRFDIRFFKNYNSIEFDIKFENKDKNTIISKNCLIYFIYSNEICRAKFVFKTTSDKEIKFSNFSVEMDKKQTIEETLPKLSHYNSIISSFNNICI